MLGRAELATRGPAQPPKAGVCLKPHNSVCDVIALLKPVQHGTEQNRDFIRGSRQWLSNRDQQRADPPPSRYVSKGPGSTMLTAISLSERPETPPSPSSTVPFLRDSDYVDRQALLERVREKCSIPASRTALVGLGGVG
jgi:hypothetical protein